jgi:Stage II sporulation protein E (SpoIIE)
MRRAGLMLVLILCAANLQVHAQAFTNQGASSQAVSLHTVQVTLGESSTDLTGPWKFHTGDNMDWARADWDDSGWKPIDLSKGLGWTKLGYAGLSGYAWYRIRLNVQGAKHQLALQMPKNVDDAYQLYVNGQLIGEFGKFTGHGVKAYPALPSQFSLSKGIKDGPITIAIRMWMDSGTIFNSPDAGGLHGLPVLGYASTVGDLIRLEYDAETARFFGSAFLECLILFMALLMAATLFWLDHEERSYLWLALVCAITLIAITIVLSVNFKEWLGQTAFVVLTDIILTPMRIGLWVIFWGYWFRVSKISRLHRLVWLLVALLMVGYAMVRPPLYGSVIPVAYGSALIALTLILKLGLGVLLLVVTYRGFATQKTEGWMAGSAVLLVFVANYQHELRQIHVPTSFSVLGYFISLGTLSAMVSLLIITVMLLRRFIMAQRLKEQWKMEIQQAQEVQQLLIPAELPEVAGMTIQSEYRPAREVGGDFFQIIPLETPGSVLIVLGDVTGKGMQAGMLVALIVGAIRGALMHSTDPARILYEVNEQLCERQHAIATCLILRIDPDGTGIIANAGQLAPYLNGTEIEMEGAFPIGIVPDGDFAITSFALTQGDNLFLMSDGVVEATDPQGALFGFDRIAELLQRHATSQEIAAAAQQFGQEDDILVLQVRRNTDQPAAMLV